MQFTFNTNRPYTVEGQRIVVQYIDGNILFNDIDRGVSGVIPKESVCYEPEDERDLKEMVTYHYDHCTYYPADTEHIPYSKEISDLYRQSRNLKGA
jgi:hypothetical protein